MSELQLWKIMVLMKHTKLSMCYTGFEPSALQPKPQGLRFNGHGGDYQLAIIVMK
jgi:hypothetical protein